MRESIALWAIILVLLPGIISAQQEDRRPRPPSVTANGEAVITVEPDQAEIDIGVVTQARSAPDAAKENAEKLARVTGEIKKLLGKGDELKTASYSLNPNYRYPQGGKPEIVGYTATNVLRIKTGNLENVGKLIDAAMKSGANTIQRLVFTLKDEQSAQLQALRLASAKAKAKAEEIASALGLKVVRILTVNEGERGVRPIIPPQARSVQADVVTAAPTPVEVGTIEVRSSVTLTAEVGPR
ncbi:MAG TPA: SIMPL domain-containing protein [Candidatus Binatia bacterium]|nr:SIMPL domain-containing protein [Candidatus Binatia bacterium]